MKIILFRILAILWMCVIFWYSAQPANISAKKSYAVGHFIGRVLVPGYEDKTKAEQDEFAMMIDHPIRKTAHALEYAILGILVFFSTSLSSNNTKNDSTWWYAPMIAIAVCVLYAISDEVHQYFVPGRACQLRDIIIDTFGALIGIITAMYISYLAKCDT